MDFHKFDDIEPFVRAVKIKKSCALEGNWTDIDHVLIYTAEGVGDYVLNGNRYHFTPGGFVLLSPFVPHLFVTPPGDMLVQYVVHFDLFSDPKRMAIPHQSAIGHSPPELPDREKLMEGRFFCSFFSHEDRYLFERLFLSVYREFKESGPCHRSMMRGLALQMISMLLRRISQEKGSMIANQPQKTKSNKLIERALEYIYLHYQENLSNETISAAIDVSPNYLCKLFQEHIGMSLHSYVLNYRLEQAQQMIASGKYNITEAALRSGFSSIHAFSKVFKQICGTSPSAYQKMVLTDSNATDDKPDYNPRKHVFYNE